MLFEFYKCSIKIGSLTEWYLLCRKKEIEDPEDVLSDKCAKLAAAIAKAKNLVVYTGAGISTAAGIKPTSYLTINLLSSWENILL